MLRLLTIGILLGLMGCRSTGEPVDAMTIEGFRAAAERNGTLATLDFTEPMHFVFVLVGPAEGDLKVYTSKGDVPNTKRIYRYVDSAGINADGDRFVKHSYICGEFEVFILTDIESLPPVALERMQIEELPFCIVQFKGPGGLFPFPLERSRHSSPGGGSDSDT